MNTARQIFMSSLILAVTLGLVACERSSSSHQVEKAATPSAPKESETKSVDVTHSKTFQISSSGMGPIKLGMTLDQARKAFSEGKFERSTDGDGAALINVLIEKEVVMTLYTDEDNPKKPIDWTKKISVIESFSPSCVTQTGIKVGTLVLDAEKVYGKTKSILKSEIESREFITFQNHPEHLSFRIDYTGIYPEGANETTKFNPQAKIFSIAVSSR